MCDHTYIYHGDKPLRRPPRIQIFQPPDHVQDWQSYPVDPYSCYMCDHTYIYHGDNPLRRPTGIQIFQPTNREHRKLIKREVFQFYCSSGRVTRQVMRHFTRNGTDHCQNGSSNLLTPYRQQSRSTRIVVAYPRPAFSAIKRINHAPI